MGSLSRKASPFPDPGKRARPGEAREKEGERENTLEQARARGLLAACPVL